MVSEVSIIVTISLIIVVSPFISRVLHVPTTPIEIVLGTVMGYFHFLGESHLLELIAEVGFFYLMFLAGTEVNLKTILTISKDLQLRATIYLTFLYLFSYIFSHILNFNMIYTVFLPLISVGLIVTLHKEFDKDTKWLDLSMIVGVLGELVSIIVLTVTGAVLEHGMGIELYETLGLLIIFLVVLAIVFKAFRILFWWYPELKTYLVPRFSDKDEKDVRLSMALFFLMIAIMLVLDLEIAFGAFIAGVFIATFFEHHQELPHKLSSFGFGFLIPIFFVYTGSTFKIDSLGQDGFILQAFMITFAMIFIRFLASFSFYKKLSFSEMTLFALSHSMPLTLLVAIATLVYHSNKLTQFEYHAFILASLFEVIIVMVSIKLIAAKQRKKSAKSLH